MSTYLVLHSRFQRKSARVGSFYRCFHINENSNPYIVKVLWCGKKHVNPKLFSFLCTPIDIVKTNTFNIISSVLLLLFTIFCFAGS